MPDALTITAYFDGRPGHDKQTQGVLQALQDLTEIVVCCREVKPLGVRKAVKDWLAYARIWPKGGYETDGIKADLIIGTGTYTHIPMLLLKRRQGGRVVTCMGPDRLLVHRMDLCFVPEHDNPKPLENIMVTTGPPNPIRDMRSHNSNRGLVLIGGLDRRSHFWDSVSTVEQLKTLFERETSQTWTVSTSPRTPTDMCTLLDAVSAASPHVDFVRWEDTPKGWVEKAYADNETVWVTADSISMIFEALSAGCRVGILPVRWRKRQSKFERAERELIITKRVQPFDRWLLTGCYTPAGPHLDEAGRCAAEMLRRWWPNRLP